MGGAVLPRTWRGRHWAGTVTCLRARALWQAPMMTGRATSAFASSAVSNNSRSSSPVPQQGRHPAAPEPTAAPRRSPLQQLPRAHAPEWNSACHGPVAASRGADPASRRRAFLSTLSGASSPTLASPPAGWPPDPSPSFSGADVEAAAEGTSCVVGVEERCAEGGGRVDEQGIALYVASATDLKRPPHPLLAGSVGKTPALR